MTLSHSHWSGKRVEMLLLLLISMHNSILLVAVLLGVAILPMYCSWGPIQVQLRQNSFYRVS